MRTALLGFMFLAVGCGSSDPCASVDPPCGGDVVGTWVLIDTCPDASCSGFEISERANNESTFTFHADGTVDITNTISGHFTYKEPLACLTDPAKTCADLSSSDSRLSVTCTGDAVCDCSGTYTPSSVMATLAYTTAGNDLTLGSGANASARGYCVKGDRLTMYGHDAAQSLVVTILQRQ